MDDNIYKKRVTGFIIHGFAVSHAIAAASLSQTLLGDEAVLTALTVAMILTIAKVNGRDWDVGEALSFLGVLAGWYLGTRGAVFLIKWIPGVGNAANSVTTFAVTEALGWATYILIKEGKKPSDINSEEAKILRKNAEEMRKQEHELNKQLYEKMSSEDKNEFESIMKQLRNKELPEETRNYLIKRIEDISKKYC